jgi:hypothetical protein
MAANEPQLMHRWLSLAKVLVLMEAVKKLRTFGVQKHCSARGGFHTGETCDNE